MRLRCSIWLIMGGVGICWFGIWVGRIGVFCVWIGWVWCVNVLCWVCIGVCLYCWM